MSMALTVCADVSFVRLLASQAAAVHALALAVAGRAQGPSRDLAALGWQRCCRWGAASGSCRAISPPPSRPS
jgi:hypothetical protein